jgi:hypothetical protein
MTGAKRPGKPGLIGRLLGRDAHKGTPPPKKRVWRISEGAPSGEWVDVDSIVSEPPPVTRPAELPTGGGWLTSSMDLLDGTEVREGADTEPDTEPAPLDDRHPRTLPLPKRGK